MPLRDPLATGTTLIAPGATDALSAKLIEAHGFDCVYIGSYATAASRFGLPDTGLLPLEALVEQARTIVNAVKLPVIADAESGFHDPAEMWRTVQAFEQAGVAAIHNLLIVARSDAFWIARDLEDCVARLQAYSEAGADMVFPTMVGPTQLAEVRRRIGKPVMIVDMPGRTIEQHRAASIVLYYAFSTLVQFAALKSALEDFRSGRHPGGQQALEDFLGY